MDEILQTTFQMHFPYRILIFILTQLSLRFVHRFLADIKTLLVQAMVDA